MTHCWQHRTRQFSISAAIGAALFSTSARGLTVPFTENFNAGTAQWFTNSAGTLPPGFQASGGPDGSGFVSHSFNFVNSAPTATPLFFRGQATFGSSGGAFVGDWIGGDVAELSAWVRHDGPNGLNFFARLAPVGGPGVVGLTPLIPSGEWTKITFPIISSAFINEGPPGSTFFNGVLSSIGNVQFGALPGPLAGVDQVVNFDIDQVRIVPEPASILLLGISGALTACRLGRRRRS